MKKLNIIKKQEEINDIIKNGNLIKNKFFFIYYKERNSKYYRFCICVSKKLGNAVVRNKNKRQIKDIIDKSNLVFKSNMDYVIILRKEISNISFLEKQKYLLDILCKLEGDQNEDE